MSRCRLCLKEGTQSTYIGETSRSLMERWGEHVEDSKKRQEGSHIAEHMMTIHPEAWETDSQEDAWKYFKLEVIKVHSSSFIRQLREACTIMLQPGSILNEYTCCIIPSLEVRGARKEDTKANLFICIY